MKSLKITTILFGAALLFSSGARAKETNKSTVHVADKLNVEGKVIDPGNYTVEWNGTGPTVQVNLIQGKQTVATFPAQLTEQAAPNPASAYGSATEPDGSKSLTAIYVGGKRYVLN
ncbi:MAG: hypothetical protein WBL63_15210, partial [Candidatus Acidiferrum sp.]